MNGTTTNRSLTSPGFLRAILGILITTLAWFGPWSWPAWPALITLNVAFPPSHPFAALPYPTRATVLSGLIVINVVTWALTAWAVTSVRDRLRTSRMSTMSIDDKRP